MVRSLLAASFVTAMVMAGGCIELQEALSGVVRDSPDPTPSPDNGGSEPDGEVDPTIPVVSLAVSNPTPQVNEEVIFRCAVASGGMGNVTFDFQPRDGRLFVNSVAGTATFIVEEADVGVAFTFTCTATSEAGTSEPSNAQTIVPTS